MSQSLHDFLTAAELAELKKVTRRTVYSWIKQGNVPDYIVKNDCYWFNRASAIAFQPPKRGKGRR